MQYVGGIGHGGCPARCLQDSHPPRTYRVHSAPRALQGPKRRLGPGPSPVCCHLGLTTRPRDPVRDPFFGMCTYMSGISMEYVWNMEYLWNTRGICMEHVWTVCKNGRPPHTYRVHSANSWTQKDDEGLARAWLAAIWGHGICMEYVWNIYGICIEYAWNMG
jgi:hypothetical protein